MHGRDGLLLLPTEILVDGYKRIMSLIIKINNEMKGFAHRNAQISEASSCRLGFALGIRNTCNATPRPASSRIRIGAFLVLKHQVARTELHSATSLQEPTTTTDPAQHALGLLPRHARVHSRSRAA